MEMRRSLSYLEDKQGDKAVDRARMAVEKDPESVDYRRSLTRILMSEKHFDEAEGHLRHLIRLGKAQASDHRLLALIHMVNDSPAEAVSSLEQAIEQVPDDASIRSFLWSARLQMKDPDPIIAEAEGVTRNHGNRHDLMMIAGMAMEMKGDTRGALAYYESAVRADPEESERYMERIRHIREMQGAGSPSR